MALHWWPGPQEVHQNNTAPQEHKEHRQGDHHQGQHLVVEETGQEQAKQKQQAKAGKKAQDQKGEEGH